VVAVDLRAMVLLQRVGSGRVGDGANGGERPNHAIDTAVAIVEADELILQTFSPDTTALQIAVSADFRSCC